MFNRRIFKVIIIAAVLTIVSGGTVFLTKKNFFPTIKEWPISDKEEIFCQNYSEQLLNTQTSQTYDDYWLFLPSDCENKIEKAPLVVLLHGWGSTDVDKSKNWIEHLTKQGNIVVFPFYEERGLENIGKGDWTIFINRAAETIKSAIVWLQEDKSKVQPDLNKFVLSGGSMGAYIAINIAAVWEEQGLPEPKIILLIHPPGKFISQDIKNPSQIPLTAFLSCFVGDQDILVGRQGCDKIWELTKHLEKRDYIWECSDNYAEPKMRAGHVSLGGPENNIETYGYWKTLDGLMDCAFYHKNCEQGFGDTAEHRYLGQWPDGKAVQELKISKEPPIDSPCVE